MSTLRLPLEGKHYLFNLYMCIYEIHTFRSLTEIKLIDLFIAENCAYYIYKQVNKTS